MLFQKSSAAWWEWFESGHMVRLSWYLSKVLAAAKGSSSWVHSEHLNLMSTSLDEWFKAVFFFFGGGERKWNRVAFGCLEVFDIEPFPQVMLSLLPADPNFFQTDSTFFEDKALEDFLAYVIAAGERTASQLVMAPVLSVSWTCWENRPLSFPIHHDPPTWAKKHVDQWAKS